MKTVTALDLRRRLGSVLNAVAEKHEPVTITRANKPLAVIISADDYQERCRKASGGESPRSCPPKWMPGGRNTAKRPLTWTS